MINEKRKIKVLWYSHVPINNILSLEESYKGGNWITSLLTEIDKKNIFELAVCFISESNSEFKIKVDNVIYYNINIRYNKVKRIFRRWKHEIENADIRCYLKVYEDFKPDIIQIFGTETEYGLLKKYVETPIIIHTQGIINACLNVWFPQRINLWSLLRSSPIKSLIHGVGNFHRYYSLKKQAKREIEIIKCNKYFFTHTLWDKAVINLFNKNAIVYQCSEAIREKFHLDKYIYPGNSIDIYRFVTIFNGELYKGWDNILLIASTLKKYTNVKFIWNLIGVNSNNESIHVMEKVYKISYAENNIEFLGKLDTEEIISELKKSHLYIHPVHIDNSPNSICEAMLLGMPVICSNVGGCSSLIENNETGILLNDNDPLIWADTINRMLQNSLKLEEIGEKARKVALQRHNMENIVNTIYNAYHNMLINN